MIAGAKVTDVPSRTEGIPILLEGQETSPSYTIPPEFRDPKTGELRNLDTSPKINFGGWSDSFTDGLSNSARTVLSLGGLANNSRNVIRAIHHPIDYIAGDYEKNLLQAKRPDLYGVMDEDLQAASTAAGTLMMSGSVLLLSFIASKNTDGGGRLPMTFYRDSGDGRLRMGALVLALSSKIPFYLGGGSLASQHRLLQGQDGHSSAAAYAMAASPYGWYLSMYEKEHRFSDYIYADFMGSIPLEGLSVFISRAANILGVSGYSLVRPLDILPFINEALIEKGERYHDLTLQLEKIGEDLQKKKGLLSEMMGIKNPTLTDFAKKEVLAEQIDRLQTQESLVSKEKEGMANLFDKLEKEAGIPAKQIASARFLEQAKVSERLAEINKGISEKRSGVRKALEESESLKGKAKREILKEAAALKRDLNLLERERKNLVYMQQSWITGHDPVKMRAESLRLETELVASGKRYRELRKEAGKFGGLKRADKLSEADDVLTEIKRQTGELDSLRERLETVDVRFVRNAEDVRDIGRRSLKGGASLGLLEEARDLIYAPTAAEKALYARSGFVGRTGHGFVNVFRHGRWKVTAGRLAGAWALFYPEGVLTYHYIWDKSWAESARSAASMFISLPLNQPWIAMLKNAHGWKSVPFVLEYAPSTLFVNGVWSVNIWDRDIMLQRCRGARMALVESLHPQFRQKIKEDVTKWYRQADENEKGRWEKECGLMPIP